MPRREGGGIRAQTGAGTGGNPGVLGGPKGPEGPGSRAGAGAESVRAIVLRAFPFAETSQVLHLFTREQGIVHGLAKGARRMTSAYHGGQDVLDVGEALLYARRGSAELRTLGGFEQTETLPGLRASLPRFEGSQRVAAVVLAFCREEQAHPDLFDLTLAALRLLDGAGEDAAAAYALGFEAMALRLLGFFPELTRCVSCARPARNVRTTRVSPVRGGLLCSACRPEDGRATPLDGTALVALRALGDGPLVDAPAHLDGRALRGDVRAVLDAWTAALLDRPLLR